MKKRHYVIIDKAKELLNAMKDIGIDTAGSLYIWENIHPERTGNGNYSVKGNYFCTTEDIEAAKDNIMDSIRNVKDLEELKRILVAEGAKMNNKEIIIAKAKELINTLKTYGYDTTGNVYKNYISIVEADNGIQIEGAHLKINENMEEMKHKLIEAIQGADNEGMLREILKPYVGVGRNEESNIICKHR